MQSRALLLVAFCALSASSQQSSELIRTSDLRADIFFLASPDLAGRQAGSSGDHVGTDYIAAQFMRLGLKPVGDNGNVFSEHRVGVRRS